MDNKKHCKFCTISEETLNKLQKDGGGNAPEVQNRKEEKSFWRELKKIFTK